MIRVQTIYFLLFGLLTISFGACRKVTGEGPMRTETRSASNFSGVDLRIAGNLYFKEAANYKVEISAQQNILDVIETYVSNGKLVIKEKNGVIIKSREDITVNVWAPSVSDLRLSGSGNIYADRVTGSSIGLNISGSGDILAKEVSTDHLDAVVSGSGNLRVEVGTTNSETLKISGSGDIDLIKLPARTANTNTSGSGTMKVNVSQKLDVTITGSGSVHYVGAPTISTHISGSGKVLPW